MGTAHRDGWADAVTGVAWVAGVVGLGDRGGEVDGGRRRGTGEGPRAATVPVAMVSLGTKAGRVGTPGGGHVQQKGAQWT